MGGGEGDGRTRLSASVGGGGPVERAGGSVVGLGSDGVRGEERGGTDGGEGSDSKRR